MSPDLTDEQMDRVVAALAQAVAANTSPQA
jgi:hypothetical protein